MLRVFLGECIRFEFELDSRNKSFEALNRSCARQAPIAIAAVYAHPVEHALCNLLPM